MPFAWAAGGRKRKKGILVRKMKLVDMTMNDYLDLLKSSAPAPGGGSVSALSAAQGVALIAMVADLTIGKEKYAEFEKGCIAAKEEAFVLFEKLVRAIDEDTEAFNMVSRTYKLPKETEEEKAARSRAISEATLAATKAPFEMMTLCVEGLKVTEKLVGKSNPNASSDLGVAALNLLSGIKGAWLNVKINLPNVKDEEAKKEFQGGERTVVKAEALAAKIYGEVMSYL